LQSYWRKKLHGSHSHNFRQERSPKEELRGIGRNKKIAISKSTSDDIRQLCAQAEATLFTFVTTCLKIVFSRYVGTTDYILGTPLSGRVHHELDNQVGNFINLIPLRTCFEPDDTFQTALEKVKSTIIESHQSGRYPFERILDDIDYRRVPGKFPLFDVVVTSQTFDNSPDLVGFGADIHVEPYTVENPAAQFPLSVDLFDNQDQIHLLINYDISLFSEKWISEFSRHIQLFIQNALAHPESNYRSLSLYGPDEESLIGIFREKFPNSSGLLFDVYTPIHEVLTTVATGREIITDIRSKFEVALSENDLKACAHCADLLAHIRFLKNGPVGFSISRGEKIQL
jgi:non-ribosomal peptide synthetase component F